MWHIEHRIRAAAALAAIFCATAPAIAQGQTTIGPPTWADEFNGTSLDLTRWTHRATGPREDGILTPDAVSVADGALTITTYTEAGQHYSGMVSTQAHETGGFQQAYGYFEARIKFDNVSGQWSAFWLQSPTVGTPRDDPAAAGVEMDVVEHRARCVTAPLPAPASTCAADADISDRVQQGLIWNGYDEHRAASVRLSEPLPGLRAGGWHTWALRWTPTELTFYYDGTAIWSQSGPISRVAEYIILSSEVRQLFAGLIPLTGYGTRETSTTKMQVDYVRVWALPAVVRSPAGAPGTEPIPGAVDASAPDAELVGRTSAKIDAPKSITIVCWNERCRASAQAVLHVPRTAATREATYRTTQRPKTIAQGAAATLKLRLSRAARDAGIRALKRGRRVVLKLAVRVADGAGNARTLTRRIALQR